MSEYKYQRSHRGILTDKAFKKKKKTYSCAGPGVEEGTEAWLHQGVLTCLGAGQ